MTRLVTDVKPALANGTPAGHPQPVIAAGDTNLFGIGALCWLCSVLILLYFHFSHTLTKPHYQFVLLVPPVIAYLLWQRLENNELRIGKTSLAVSVFLLVPLALGAVASWWFSPWLGMAAVVALGPSVAIAFGGWRLFASTWNIWLLAMFMLPLPLRIDERLIVELRDVATKLTSRILDYFGVLHMISGNVIELPEKKLFVADACSGIHSLFVLLAAAAVIAVWNQRGPIATCLLMIATFGLVMIENILRLLIVSGSIRIGYDLSEGMSHQILGFVLFAFSLSMIVSCDQIIDFLSFRRTSKRRSNTISQIPTIRTRLFAWVGMSTLLFIPVQWVRMPAEVPNLAEGFKADIEIPELGRDFLPEKVGRFSLVEYDRIVRVPEDPFGHHSQIWRYEDGNRELTLSMNYAYRGVHDACLCYRNTGWNVEDEKVVGAVDTGGAMVIVDAGTDWSQTPAVSAVMSHPLEGHGQLFYSMISQSGRVGVGIDSRKLGSTTGQAAGRFGEQSLSVPEQFVQLQMVTTQAGAFSEQETAELEEVFRDFQAKLFQRCVEELVGGEE